MFCSVVLILDIRGCIFASPTIVLTNTNADFYHTNYLLIVLSSSIPWT